MPHPDYASKIQDAEIGSILVFGDGLGDSVWVKTESNTWTTHRKRDRQIRGNSGMADMCNTVSPWSIS